MYRSPLFDWLRLLGALMVLFGHSFTLAGHPPVSFFDVHIEIAGVMLFFVISGYLITASAAKRDFLSFATARALRIFPALAVVTVATVVVVGPIATTLPIAEYAGSPESWKFLWRNLIALPYFELPGVFNGNPIVSVNGSLWSLPVELALYVCAFALAFLPRAAAIAICGIAAAALALWHPHAEALIAPTRAAPFFFLGATARHLGLLMPRIKVPVLRNDLSYGTYLIGYPVQQVLIAKGVIDPLAVFAVAAIIVLPLAWLSWSFVEGPFMSLRQTPVTSKQKLEGVVKKLDQD